MSLDEHTNQTAAQDLTQLLNQLWTRFLPEIRERAEILHSAASACAESAMSDELRESAHAAAHKLAGSLGTFNLGRGTELAREFEQASASEESCKAIGAERLMEIAAEIRTIIEGRK